MMLIRVSRRLRNQANYTSLGDADKTEPSSQLTWSPDPVSSQWCNKWGKANSTLIGSWKVSEKLGEASRKACKDVRDWLYQELEPISKLLQEHGDAGELHKTEEVGGVVLPANQQAAVSIGARERSVRRASDAGIGVSGAHPGS